MRRVEIIEEKRVFDRFFRIDEARLRYERFDGTMSAELRRLNFERGDSVAAIVVNRATRTVYLTEQFKYPASTKGDGWIVEIVAGTIDPGESAEQAIRREILEEIGFAPTSVTPIGSFFVSPGGTSERIFLFNVEVTEADRRSKGGGLPSEGEDIRIVEWPVAAFLAKLDGGELHDAKTIVAAYWLKCNHRI
jgi:ADP-ribose pyrophosphatase